MLIILRLDFQTDFSFILAHKEKNTDVVYVETLLY